MSGERGRAAHFSLLSSDHGCWERRVPRLWGQEWASKACAAVMDGSHFDAARATGSTPRWTPGRWCRRGGSSRAAGCGQWTCAERFLSSPFKTAPGTKPPGVERPAKYKRPNLEAFEVFSARRRLPALASNRNHRRDEKKLSARPLPAAGRPRRSPAKSPPTKHPPLSHSPSPARAASRCRTRRSGRPRPSSGS